MKKCSTCKEEKELTEFNKDKKAKDGLRYQCKQCRSNRRISTQEHKRYYLNNKEKVKQYHLDNKEKIAERRKQHHLDNKERLNQISRQYYLNNKEILVEKSKQYYLDNKIKLYEYKKLYIKKNKEKVIKYRKQYYLDNKEKANHSMKQYMRNRKQIDPLFKLRCNIRSLIYNQLKKQGYPKKSKTHQILGCDFETFKTHLQKQFTEGMNWENQGQWHLDHIYPVSLAKDEQHLIELNHYTNFQPLWAFENLSKGNRVDFNTIEQ